VVSNNPVHRVDYKNCEMLRFTILKLSFQFPQVSGRSLYEIFIAKLGWLPQVLWKDEFQTSHRCAHKIENSFLQV
jgi:hypothetical protein